jgi:tetratricopeptide (TPR) repeat protein
VADDFLPPTPRPFRGPGTGGAGECPPAAELEAFHSGDLPAAAVDRVTAHVERCPVCEQALCRLDAGGDTLAAAIRCQSPPPPPEVGRVVGGRYKLLQQIGEGGMGSVWMAQQTEPVRRLVAVKLVKPGHDSKAVLARFEAERQALALMDHPNIAKVLDAGTADGRPYFVMELVKGTRITRHCDAHKLTTRERLELFVPVCQAVQHAHQKGIIHRDLKPSNVLVSLYDGRPVPKVIDFGVAKAARQALTDKTLVTGFGALVGTPEYMAPEQAELNQLDVDTRADIYALGVLLYELLTGTTPLNRAHVGETSLLEVLRRIREDEPPPPSARLGSSATLPALAASRHTEPRRLASLVRGELDWIVMKALEKDRGRRYETATGLAKDVKRYLAGDPVEARPTSRVYRARKWLRRYARTAAAAALVLVALVVGLVVSLFMAHRATTAEARTRRALEDVAAQHAAAKDELATRELVQQFFLDKVFSAARPLGQDGGLGKDVTLRRALDATVPTVGDTFRDRPLVEAAVRRALGRTYLDLGEWIPAAAQFEHVVRLRERHLPAGHLDITRAQADLAAARVEGWDLAALPLFEKALAAFRAALGPDDAETLACQNGYADALRRANRNADAVLLYEQGVERMRAALGAEHPVTLAGLEGLAVSYKMAGRAPDAVPLAEEVVRVRTAKYGPDRQATLESQHTLAVLYSATGRAPQAVTLFEQVVPPAKERLGPMHSLTFQSMHSLALTYERLDRLPDAVRLREEILDLWKWAGRATDVDLMGRTGELADAYAAAGRTADAIRRYEEILAWQRKHYGARDAGTLRVMCRIGDQLLRDGRAAEAGPLLDECLTGFRASLAADEPLLADRLTEVGAALVRGGLAAAAESPLRQAVALRRRVAPDTWQLAESEALLGAAHLDQQQAGAAEPLLAAGYEGLRKRADQLPPRLRTFPAEVAGRLAKLCAAAG